MDLPDTLEELTPQWLTCALRSTGALQDGQVTRVESEPVGADIGVIGQLARLRLTLEPRGTGPCTLVVKLPSADPEIRDHYWRLERGNIYERESLFYQRLAPRIRLATPRCHYAAYNYPQRKFILLLEDMAATRPGDQIAGCSLDEATGVLKAMARFHAGYWTAPDLSSLDWIPSYEFESERLHKTYVEFWPVFLEKFAHLLPAGALAIGEMLLRDGLALRYELAQAPHTLIHCDFRLDNLFFREGKGIAACDWQTYRRGPAAWDLATFLCWSLTPEQRQESEGVLLQTYHAALLAEGVADYTYDRLQADFRLGVMGVFFHMVRCFAFLDFGDSERLQKNTEVSIPRVSAAALAHSAAISVNKTS